MFNNVSSDRMAGTTSRAAHARWAGSRAQAGRSALKCAAGDDGGVAETCSAKLGTR